MSAYQNITSLTDAFVVTNTITDGYFAPGIMVVIWIVLFGYALPQGRAQAITYASLIAGLCGMLLNIMGIIPYWVLTADLILFAIGIFMLMAERKSFEA